MIFECIRTCKLKISKLRFTQKKRSFSDVRTEVALRGWHGGRRATYTTDVSSSSAKLVMLVSRKRSVSEWPDGSPGLSIGDGCRLGTTTGGDDLDDYRRSNLTIVCMSC